jgi:hypothetical protein
MFSLPSLAKNFSLILSLLGLAGGMIPAATVAFQMDSANQAYPS